MLCLFPTVVRYKCGPFLCEHELMAYTNILEPLLESTRLV